MSDNKDLKIIKKLYGEKMMHLCREYFPTILDSEGRLSQILQSCFAPTKALYDELVKQEKTDEFRSYIFALYEKEQRTEQQISDKTPAELLDEAGYILYPECQSEEEIQSYKKYYAPGEELCTFKGNRLNTCRVWFAVKKDVENIKREDFTNPEREDTYGTSVISIQFTKQGGWISIKNRYNHAVPNPDSTFSNKLDNIIYGLDASFRKYYSLPTRKVLNGLSNGLANFILASDGKYYHYNTQVDNFFFCEDNIVVDNDHVTQFDKNSCILMDNILLNKKNKTIEVLSDLYGYDDSCLDGVGTIAQIQEVKKDNGEKDIILTNTDGKNVVFTINKFNQIVGYANENLTHARTNFLAQNKYVRTVSLPNVQVIENKFLCNTFFLENIDISKVEKIGDYCLSNCENLESIMLPNLKEVGINFLAFNYNLKNIEISNIEKVGHKFLAHNTALEEISVPKLREIKNHFLSYNNKIKTIDLPNVETIGSHFFVNNQIMEEINLPQVKNVGDCFLETNMNVKEVNLPNLQKCGVNFFANNEQIESLNMPNLVYCDIDFLMTNKKLTSLNLPNLKACEGYFLAMNSKIQTVNLPNLEYCGRHFLSNNTELESIDLPCMEEVGDYFMTDNEKISKVCFPELAIVGKNFMKNDRNLKLVALPKLVSKGPNFIESGFDAKIYAPNCEKKDSRFIDNDKKDEEADELTFGV